MTKKEEIREKLNELVQDVMFAMFNQGKPPAEKVKDIKDKMGKIADMVLNK